MPIKLMFGTNVVKDAVLSVRYSRLRDRILHISYNPKEGFKVYKEDMITWQITLSAKDQAAKDFVRNNFGHHGMNLLRIHSKGEFTDKEAEVVEKVFQAFSYRLKQRQEGREMEDQYIGPTPDFRARNTFIDKIGEEDTITLDEEAFTVV